MKEKKRHASNIQSAKPEDKEKKSQEIMVITKCCESSANRIWENDVSSSIFLTVESEDSRWR